MRNRPSRSTNDSDREGARAQTTAEVSAGKETGREDLREQTPAEVSAGT
jgi:hypothetical protein